MGLSIRMRILHRWLGPVPIVVVGKGGLRVRSESVHLSTHSYPAFCHHRELKYLLWLLLVFSYWLKAGQPISLVEFQKAQKLVSHKTLVDFQQQNSGVDLTGNFWLSFKKVFSLTGNWTLSLCLVTGCGASSLRPPLCPLELVKPG